VPRYGNDAGGRSLNPLSSMKTMVRPSFWAFFKLRPSLLLPAPDGRFVPFQSSPHRPLTTPTHLAQDLPNMPRMIPDAILSLD